MRLMTFDPNIFDKTNILLTMYDEFTFLNLYYGSVLYVEHSLSQWSMTQVVKLYILSILP